MPGIMPCSKHTEDTQNTVPAGTELSLLGKDVQAVGFHCDKSNDVGSKNDDT